MSKRIFLTVFVLVVLVIFVSCNASIKMLDEDGFAIYQCGWALDDNQVLIQSHDGYVLDERFYTEHIDTIEPIIEENEVVIYANDSYLVGVACFQ